MTSPSKSATVIRGGLIVDGTGKAPFAGDLLMRGGAIAAVGEVSEASAEGARVLEADGCWVTPGFVDPHTHLDAQLCWDGSGSPSNRHGVTTIVMGLCGFGVAPCPAGGGEYLLKALEVVEEIPYASTSLGVPFKWRTWREYRDFIAQQPLGVNVTGYVPHSALRYFAMGERARSETANADDIAAMRAELEDALAAGAVGLATSRGPNHVDGFGEPVPSRVADPHELRELVQACRGKIFQINVETKFSHDAAALIAEVETYAGWARDAGARLTWTPFYAEPGETVWREVLDHNRKLNATGVTVTPQITAVPITLMLRFNERSFLTAVVGWADVLAGFFKLEPEERKRRLADPAVRSAMKVEGGDSKNPLTPDFDLWVYTFSPSRPDLANLSLSEAAARDGVHPVDLLCDVVIADELETLVDVPVLNRSREGVVKFLEDGQTLLGLGDAGAHVMTVTNYRYPTFMLAELVQKQRALSVELAVNRLTQVPAQMHGLNDRGELRPGAAADVCVIDRKTLELGPAIVAHDLPGNHPRLVQSGFGFRAIFVNGIQTANRDKRLEVAPGAILANPPAGPVDA